MESGKTQELAYQSHTRSDVVRDVTGSSLDAPSTSRAAARYRREQSGAVRSGLEPGGPPISACKSLTSSFGAERTDLA